jgi:hypothetical protein
VFMVTVATTVILSFYFDAPLKELANPAVPENPAKAPCTSLVFRSWFLVRPLLEAC